MLSFKRTCILALLVILEAACRAEGTAGTSPAGSASKRSAAGPAAEPRGTPLVGPGKATALPPSVQHIVGSTVKLEQLIGDLDKERHQKTRGQSFSRYRIEGTDLGYSFEHDGRATFLFGDTIGALHGALDTIAMTDAEEPEAGVRLDFLTEGDRYLTIRPPGIPMGEFNVPVSGIEIGGQTYVAVKTDHSTDRDEQTDRTVLTRWTAPASFHPLRTISQLPSGRFSKLSLHLQTSEAPGLPAGGPWVFMWGTGLYRSSDAYLAIVPAVHFENGQGTRYFTGTDAAGEPTWGPREADAKAIVQDGTMGDLSVTWCKDLGLWLMTYDRRDPGGIAFQYSRTPWGPWSAPETIFQPQRDHGIGKFIHDSDAPTDDGLAGPVIGKGQKNPRAVHGGDYAPYVVERWTKVRGGKLELYYVMSTWNPYVVVLMKSAFSVR
jgi:hypothetical protein